MFTYNHHKSNPLRDNRVAIGVSASKMAQTNPSVEGEPLRGQGFDCWWRGSNSSGLLLESGCGRRCRDSQRNSCGPQLTVASARSFKKLLVNTLVLSLKIFKSKNLWPDPLLIPDLLFEPVPVTVLLGPWPLAFAGGGLIFGNSVAALGVTTCSP